MSSFWIHHAILKDRTRLRASFRAFREVLRPGSVVVDLGAGTGILGLLALRAGAGRVYAIDRHPILRLARELAKENGVEDRISFIQADSRRVRLPEKADLVVCYMPGIFGIDPEMAESLRDARRFLKPGGKFVPERSEVWIAPISSSAAFRQHVRSGEGFGVRLRALQAITSNRPGDFFGCPYRLKAPARRAFAFEPRRDRAIFPRRAALSFKVSGGELHGLAVFVRVQYSPSVRVGLEKGGSWRPTYLPISCPFSARAGQRIPIELVLHGNGAIEWSLGEQRQCTLFERCGE
jgi:protein arginine N-methyltransferase 1